MKIEVSATRMELMNLRRRLGVAVRGHKLLKDKLDELMRHFLRMIKGYKALHQEVEELILEAHKHFLFARATMTPIDLREALMVSAERQLTVSVSWENIMNVRVPKMEIKGEVSTGQYGYLTTSADLDLAIALYKKVLPKLLGLAEKRSSLEILATEIESTRRRVNALEYVLIPTIEETIHDIVMRMNELERSNLTRLMRVKEIVRKH
ncbi:MAG: V-type ATP synthase subunit D [Candidatus Sumerlaeota bacterium]|nr:V-type ATP synthase subunit D [Candidatus Sumerlaeota bacterium]